MDLTKFKLNNSFSEKEITEEIVNLIGNMFFGSNEVNTIPFENKNPNDLRGYPDSLTR